MVDIKLVTVATQSERYFPILVESCKKHGADLVVLGYYEIQIDDGVYRYTRR